MSFDLVIRSGTVVDGTGAEPRTADVAIRDGVVVEVGAVDGRGAREIDAGGAVVTPGFVDVHTHYDGQATWDHRLQPSSLHGVTTVVAGNCGVGFAPVRTGDREMLVELMEGVEDLPGVVLHEGLSWAWESISDYLDALDQRAYDVDIATQVCHAPIRVYVMGERGANREPATADEIDAMGRLAADGVRAGALGFSTSRTLNHRTSRGEPTPTLTAARAELVGIAGAIGATGRGVLQVVSDFTEPDERETLLEMMRVSGRPLSFSLAQFAPGRSYGKQLALLDRARAEGLAMRAQVAARGIGLLHGLQCSVNPLSRCAAWREVAGEPIDQQAAALGQPGRRERLIAEARENLVGSAVDRIFPLTDPVDYEPSPDDTVAARAAREGVDAIEWYVDHLLSDGGRGMVYVPFLNYADGNLDAAAELLQHPFTIPGLGDGGAHVGLICDASFPTTLLTHWIRDRRDGVRLALPFVVQRQCQATAEAVGLFDRGVLAPGYKADVNVIDLDNLALDLPRIVQDLPAGGKRVQQRARGYLHTIVAGVETYQDGEPTDAALPGRLIRGQQSAPSAAASTR